MSATFRTASGGRIDRGKPVRFSFDGQADMGHEDDMGHEGDTLASTPSPASGRGADEHSH